MNIKNVLIGALLVSAPFLVNAQGSKVQTAWRNLDDYKLNNDVASIVKAKEAIDLAAVHEDTKEKAKTWSYRTEIYYFLYREDLKKEKEKLAGVTDKKEQEIQAYGNVSMDNFNEMKVSLAKLVVLDKDKSYLQTQSMIGAKMVDEINNLALGRYKAKKYEEASQMYFITYEAFNMMGVKDTGSLFNAIISSRNAKNNELVKKYCEVMVKDKIANPYTFATLYDAKLALGDTAGAFESLTAGRKSFPSDMSLMNMETEYYLKRGKQDEALANLNKSIEKDPGNYIFYLVRGNIYDNLANPKDNNNKDKEKPKEYEELMQKAAADYTKASELDAKNFDVFYNLGALYNNWGGYYQGKADAITKMNAEQKALGDKAMEKFKLAIPVLEKALAIKENDKTSMMALRKLYLITGDTVKAKEMSERMKK
ncbi:MAG TPA: hypothetical protein VGF30_01045 [Bacteroidia bacterium]